MIDIKIGDLCIIGKAIASPHYAVCRAQFAIIICEIQPDCNIYSCQQCALGLQRMVQDINI